jgi:hypothetical protein
MGIIIGGNTISGNFNNLGESQNTPNVVTNGLVLHLDAGNDSSYINSSNYYDCGYGCQYYSSNPGCTNCNTQWKDISGYGNDWGKTGTYNGTYFTYNSTTLSRAASSDWATTAERTIDTWFYPSSGGINTGCCQTIFGSYWFRFFMIGQGIYLMIGFANADGSYNTYTHPSFSISYDTWHHIVGMRRGNDYIMWIDGVEMYNSTFGSGLILYDPYGTYYMSDSSHSNERIGSAKIYNRGLTNEEIIQNFNSGRQRFGI